jgi:hypothetical protein
MGARRAPRPRWATTHKRQLRTRPAQALYYAMQQSYACTLHTLYVFSTLHKGIGISPPQIIIFYQDLFT